MSMIYGEISKITDSLPVGGAPVPAFFEGADRFMRSPDLAVRSRPWDASILHVTIATGRRVHSASGSYKNEWVSWRG